METALRNALPKNKSPSEKPEGRDSYRIWLDEISIRAPQELLGTTAHTGVVLHDVLRSRSRHGLNMTETIGIVNDFFPLKQWGRERGRRDHLLDKGWMGSLASAAVGEIGARWLPPKERSGVVVGKQR